MTEQDERAVARAVAETFRYLIDGALPLDEDSVERLLYFALNPYNTQAAFDFLGRVVGGMRGDRPKPV